MIKTAFHDALKWNNKFYFGSISTSIATFFLFHNLFAFEFIRSIRYGVAMFLLSLLLRTIYEFGRRLEESWSTISTLKEQVGKLETATDLKRGKSKTANQLMQKEFYGESLIALKDLFARINKHRRNNQIDNKDLVHTLTSLCDKLKHIFETRLPNNVYSVSIKTFLADGNSITIDSELITIARDNTSFNQRHNGNDTVKHTIVANTCFQEILNKINQPGKCYYLNDDIPSDKYYKNSSFAVYGEIPSTITTIEERRKHWTLPYQSELVVPLAPINPNLDRIDEFNGYLCIDCDSPKAFHKIYDAGMFQGLADGVFDLIEINKKK